VTKKQKTPRIGVPPEGYIRVVIDYPETIGDDALTLQFELEHGHRIGCKSNQALAPWGRLIRYIRRTEDGKT
jgi:hypothetical protein